MLTNLKIICQFHAHSVHRDISGTTLFRAEIYWGRLLTFITGSISRLLRIRFSADLTMYWFPVYHFRCMKEIPHLHGGLQYLKYYIKMEKNSTFYMSPKQTEQINMGRSPNYGRNSNILIPDPYH
jgi:hypothetical protein